MYTNNTNNYLDSNNNYLDSNNNYNSNNEEEVEEKPNFFKSNSKLLVIALILVIVILILYFLSNRNNSSSKNNYILNIYPDNIIVSVGKSQKISYEVRNNGKNIANAVVKFAINDSSVARIDNTNIVGLKYGKTTIVATYDAGNNNIIRKEKEVIVADGDPNNPISNVSFLDNDLQMSINEVYYLKYDIVPSNGYVESKRITSSDTSIVTVDDSGKLTAVGVGYATVTIDINNGRFTKNINVSVADGNVAVTDIKLDITDLPLTVGQVQTIIPEVLPAEAKDKTLSYSSNNVSVVTTTPSADTSSVSILAVAEGTAVVTIRSVNGIEKNINVTVTKAPSGGSQTSSSKCYCNSSSTSCVWSSGPRDDYTLKQSNIPNSSACSIYGNGGLCFKNSSGEYKFGKFGNTSGYTYVAGATNQAACTSKGDNPTSQIASLKCSSGIVGGTTSCTMSTDKSPYTIKSASSSNTEIATVSVSGNKVNVKCQKKGTVTIQASPANGLPSVRDNVVCSGNLSFKVTCPGEIMVNKTGTITSSSTKIKCSGSSSAFTVSSDCKVKGVKSGSGKVTVTSTENSNMSTTCNIKVVEEQKKEAKVVCNSKVEGDTKKIATCTNCIINGNAGASKAGTYIIYATANNGYLFSDGTKTQRISCTIKAKEDK